MGSVNLPARSFPGADALKTDSCLGLLGLGLGDQDLLCPLPCPHMHVLGRATVFSSRGRNRESIWRASARRTASGSIWAGRSIVSERERERFVDVSVARMLFSVSPRWRVDQSRRSCSEDLGYSRSCTTPQAHPRFPRPPVWRGGGNAVASRHVTTQVPVPRWESSQMSHSASYFRASTTQCVLLATLCRTLVAGGTENRRGAAVPYAHVSLLMPLP